MKKIMLGLLGVTSVFSLTACSKANVNKNEDSKEFGGINLPYTTSISELYLNTMQLDNYTLDLTMEMNSESSSSDAMYNRVYEQTFNFNYAVDKLKAQLLLNGDQVTKNYRNQLISIDEFYVSGAFELEDNLKVYLNTVNGTYRGVMREEFDNKINSLSNAEFFNFMAEDLYGSDFEEVLNTIDLSTLPIDDLFDTVSKDKFSIKTPTNLVAPAKEIAFKYLDVIGELENEFESVEEAEEIFNTYYDNSFFNKYVFEVTHNNYFITSINIDIEVNNNHKLAKELHISTNNNPYFRLSVDYKNVGSTTVSIPTTFTDAINLENGYYTVDSLLDLFAAEGINPNNIIFNSYNSYPSQYFEAPYTIVYNGKRYSSFAMGDNVFYMSYLDDGSTMDSVLSFEEISRNSQIIIYID